MAAGRTTFGGHDGSELEVDRCKIEKISENERVVYAFMYAT